MRIVVLCADLGIRVPGDKGASLHLQGITRGFGQAGHDVLLVAVAGHGEPPADLGAARLLPHPGRAAGLRRELRKIAFCRALPDRVGAAVADFAPDLLYERSCLFGTAGLELARRQRLPHVLEVNALLAGEDAAWRGLRLRRLAQRRERALLAGIDLRVTVSAELATAVEAQAPGVPTVVVPNGVDADAFRQLPDRAAARRRLGLSEGHVVLGFAGALRPWHGLDVALEALGRLPAHFHLAIAGDGPIAGDLRRRATELGVPERVRWLGRLPHSEMALFLGAVDVALAPYPASRDFAFSPLKVYEYLAAGLPVVASDIGQLRSLLGGGRGWLVPAGDPRAMARACLEAGTDLAGWRSRGAALREEALTEHTWRRRAEQIVTAFAQNTSQEAPA